MFKGNVGTSMYVEALTPKQHADAKARRKEEKQAKKQRELERELDRQRLSEPLLGQAFRDKPLDDDLPW